MKRGKIIRYIIDLFIIVLISVAGYYLFIEQKETVATTEVKVPKKSVTTEVKAPKKSVTTEVKVKKEKNTSIPLKKVKNSSHIPKSTAKEEDEPTYSHKDMEEVPGYGEVLQDSTPLTDEELLEIEEHSGVTDNSNEDDTPMETEPVKF